MAVVDAGLPRLRGEQARASAPDAHVWLAASAGTGKTQVLAARVFRLLLNDVDPGAILCLTFTKAGAAEMAERINHRLAAWVRLAEVEVGRDLISLGEDPTPILIARARTLFARVLDAPGGGVRIQTIHAFCQTLLASFPVEAGLTPGFRPLEAREEALLRREVLAELLATAERDGRAEPLAAVGALSMRLGEEGAEAFLAACARAPDALAALPGGVRPWVRRHLDLPIGDIEAAIGAECGRFDEGALHRLAELNAGWSAKAGPQRHGVIREWLALDADGRGAGLDTLHLIWAKADGEIRSFGKGQAPQHDDYPPIATELHGRCGALLRMRDRARYADLLAEGLTVGRDYAAAYQAAKRRLGAVDFDDLIRRVVALFGQPGMGDWVRFKLDQVTDHVLVDEAQDTNAAQWEIVSAVVDEFFLVEEPTRGRHRTLFTVGDHKQAIFGFQGTDPRFFDDAQRRFRELAQLPRDRDFAPALPFEELSLTSSFRSTRPVLQFVDAALGLLPAPGLGPLRPAEPHRSEVAGPGRMTLWTPTLAAEAADGDEEGWVDDAVRAHAARIARQVRRWLDDGLLLESKGRPLRPEDVMILVKRRGELASLIVARLYAEGVPVAGVDRLRLTAPLAVQDLLAAIRFALQPADDLSLASLLVSPLIGWSQDELMDAALRERGALWPYLLDRQPPERLAPLRDLLRRADFQTPYAFLEEMLSGALDGRRKLIRRLGPEARDPIEELLNAALEFERVSTPSLQRFLDWFDRGEVEIVRDPSAPLDAVRVMTAHGAKGLQAPLVLLADATADPDRRPRAMLSWTPAPGVTLPVFRPRREEATGPLADALAEADGRDLAEHWRLFYVAATRAEERLEIAGALGPRARGVPPANSWYAVAGRALDLLGVAAAGDERSYRGTPPPSPIPARAREQAVPPEHVPLPDWARVPAPVEARPPRPLSPSSLGVDDVADPPPGPALRAAAERGRLLHALFERLPAVAPADRAGAADRWLERVGRVADAAVRAELIATVTAVLDRPDLAELFGDRALAEAPLSAVLPDGQVITGTIDRLLVTPERIRLIDFKTGRIAPDSVATVPGFHLRQMAAYRAALAVIFPGRPIEAALLYTAGPILIALPDALLDRHKPGLAAPEQSLTALPG